MKKLFTILLFLFIITQQLFAVSAYPHPIQYQLPDNTTITITLKGDEIVHWAITLDGYALMLNKNGYYEYAILDEYLDMVCSGIRANNIEARSSEEIIFLQTIEKDLRFSSEQIYYMRSLRGFEAEFIKNNGSRFVGEVHAPLILVDFPNNLFTKTQEDFQLLMNQPNYYSGEHNGSVYDFFYSNSYGQLEFTVDVYGPYTMSQDVGHYDNNTAGGDSRLMAREAAIAAHEDGCDFSVYDLDDDGNVDGLHIIFAGHGQEAGAPVGQSIWSHAWSIYNYHLTLDEKRVYRFSCSPELRGSNGNNITFIGVIAHELSHVFGLPDLYDTDYSGSGGQSVDLGAWDIMAGGSWNDNGRTPANHNAWSKSTLEWIEIITLSSPCEITIPNPQEVGIGYRINTQTDNEYFILENRQKVDWDAYIPNSGMLIFHIDENYSGWGNNCINCYPAHRGMYIKQAGGGPNSNSTNRSNDPYPRAGNTSFTDLSVPNAKSWAGMGTGKPVTEISHNTNDSTIYFKFMDGNLFQVALFAYPQNAGTVTGSNLYLEGTDVTVTASAAYNFVFKEWRVNNEVVSTSTSYTFTVSEDIELTAHFASKIATLSNITLSEGTLTPSFNPSGANYTVHVECSQISITGIPSNENATVDGNVEDATLDLGSNIFPIIVTAEDEVTTRTYTVTVNRTLLSVNNIDNSQINIYPNPTNSYVIVESEEIITSISLFNSIGVKLFENKNIGEKSFRIDIDDFASGIYFIRIDGETRKLIKE